jgi:GAF domain-containing protein
MQTRTLASVPRARNLRIYIAASTVLTLLAAVLFALSARYQATTDLATLAGALVTVALSVISFLIGKKTRDIKERVQEFAKGNEFTVTGAFERAGRLASVANRAQAYQISLAFCDLLLTRALTTTPKADRCAIWLPEKLGGGLSLFLGKARNPSPSASFSKRLTETSSAVSALANGKILRVEKGAAELQKQRIKPEYRYIAYICVPLRDGAHKVGVLTLDTSKYPSFTRDDEIRLDKLAVSAAAPLRKLLERADVHNGIALADFVKL